MGVTCETIWRDSSEYLEGTLLPETRRAMDEHIQGCQKCTAVMQGLRNIVNLYGDERMAEVPAGFSQRLHQRIEANMPRTRRNFFGWAVAFATSVLAVGTIELARSSAGQRAEVQSKLAQHAKKPIPPDMPVVVSDNGKLFHRAACGFILNRATIRKTTAGEALQEGLTPCTRCLSAYL